MFCISGLRMSDIGTSLAAERNTGEPTWTISFRCMLRRRGKGPRFWSQLPSPGGADASLAAGGSLRAPKPAWQTAGQCRRERAAVRCRRRAGFGPVVAAEEAVSLAASISPRNARSTGRGGGRLAPRKGLVVPSLPKPLNGPG